MKLSALRVFVHDLPAAKAFYERKLGLTLTHDGANQGYACFDAGGVTLVVEQVADDAPADDQALAGRFLGVSFGVNDIHAEHRRLVELGVPCTGAPEQQFWGGWLASFQDPAGNTFQLAQYR